MQAGRMLHGGGRQKGKPGKERGGVVLVTLDPCVRLYLWYVKCCKFQKKTAHTFPTHLAQQKTSNASFVFLVHNT